ncbi:MAG: CHAT domain-containing protein [Cyanobacteria bacterium P01_H01_bin.130]
MQFSPYGMIAPWCSRSAVMRVWAGAIALGLVMGLPVGGAVRAIEPRVIEGALTTDDRKLNNGKYLDVYQFQGQAGERVALELESDEFDAVLGVVHNRALLVGDNNSGGLTDALIVVELPETGAYQVLVNTVKVGATGKYRLSWRTATLGDQQRLEAFQLNRQALQLSSRSQLRESMTLLQRANQLYSAAGDRIGESTTLNNIGEIYRGWGQYPQALERYQQALAISRELGDRTVEGTVLSNMGLVYYSQGNSAQALDYYQRALAIRREVSDLVGEGTTLNNIGLIHHSQGQYSQALEYYQQSLAIRRETGDRAGEATTLSNIGVFHYRQGQYAQALAPFRQSIATSEAIEQDLSANDQDRIAFFETRAATYALLNATLIHQIQTATALELADRSRARSLVQFLTPSTGDQPGQGVNINSISIDQIKRLARDKNATLITYAIVNADLYIWEVSPTGELNFVKSDPEAAGLTIRTASSGIRSAATLGPLNDQLFNRAQYRIDLQALRGEGTGPLWAGSPQHLEQGYNLLIKPIEAYLPKPTGSRLIIVPHRELGTVPFAALFKEGEGFLIDRYTITVTPSLQTLNTLQQQTPSATGSPLVVGNPSPMVNQLSQLPASEAEATEIAQKLNTPPILGNQATEAAINAKLSTANILHFATHGVIPKSDRDLNSWLALADISSKSGEDNKLTISEIFNSNLNAQLAVLSACNTNSGEISGEGVVGLARAFLKAGVPTVVASSWKVPDRETQMLMEEFYDQLLAGNTYAEALRAAQLKVRAQSPNPFAWAAFTVIGEGDRTLIQN